LRPAVERKATRRIAASPSIPGEFTGGPCIGALPEAAFTALKGGDTASVHGFGVEVRGTLTTQTDVAERKPMAVGDRKPSMHGATRLRKVAAWSEWL